MPSLKAKREKQTKKGAKKITLFGSWYIFLASHFCTTWLSGCTNIENDVEVSRPPALNKTSLFLPAFLHAIGLEITKIWIAVLIKETKVKTSLLSLTLEPGYKSLVCSIIFFIIRENKNSKQKMGRIYINSNLDFDVCGHECPELSVYWMILARKWNMNKNVLLFKKMPILFLINSFTWLFFGWRLQ